MFSGTRVPGARDSSAAASAWASSVRSWSRCSLAMLLAVVALAVLREGSEIVLFLYGMAAGGAGKADLLLGMPVGLGGGVAVGFALYFGLLRIPMKHFFN